MTNKPSIEYFAGLVDGEGHIGIQRSKPNWVSNRTKSPKYMLRFSIRMCDPRAIELFRKHFKDTLYYRTEERKGNWKPIHSVVTFGWRAENIIRTLLPHLIVKREEAKLALEFRKFQRSFNCRAVGFNRRPVPDYILQKRHSFYLKMKQLKVRIVPSS